MKNINSIIYTAIVSLVISIISGVIVFYLTSDTHNIIDVRAQFITLEENDNHDSARSDFLKNFLKSKNVPVYNPETGLYSSEASIVALKFKNNSNRKISSIELIGRDLIFALNESNTKQLIPLTGNGLLEIGDLNIDQEKRVFIGFSYSKYEDWQEKIKIVADGIRVNYMLDHRFGFISTNLGLAFLTLGVIGILPLSIFILLIPFAIIFHYKPDWEFSGMSEKQKDKTIRFAKKIIQERQAKYAEISNNDHEKILNETENRKSNS